MSESEINLFEEGNDEVVRYLTKTFHDNIAKVEQIALKEMNSIEWLLPELSILCVQGKPELVNFLKKFKKRYSNEPAYNEIKPYIVTIAIVIDNVTCMLTGNTFYTSTISASANQLIIVEIIQLAQLLKNYIQKYSDAEVFDTKNVAALIKLLEIASKRIGINSRVHENYMLDIINSIKFTPLTPLSQSRIVTSNTKTAIDKNHNFEKKNTGKKENVIPKVENFRNINSPGKIVKKTPYVTVKKEFSLKQPDDGKKKLNAFEIMMNKAKLLKKPFK